MLPLRRLSLGLLASLLALTATLCPAADADEASLRKAVTLYASFDEAVRLDFGSGEPVPGTRSVAADKKFVFDQGFDPKFFRIAKDKGISGGCLEAVDLPPRGGRLWFPAKGNVAFKKDAGWGGAPLTRLKAVGFKAGEWHHIVLTWDRFNTGSKDGAHTLYVDGKKIGDLQNYEVGMDWDIERARVYFAVNLIGLLDELAVFQRPLTAEEVALLHKKPGVLQPLQQQRRQP